MFEIFPQLEDLEVGHLGGNIHFAQLFCFCNGNVKTLRIDIIWSFATFNLYTVPAKIQYIQRYLTDFRNLCLSSKMLGMGIWVESLRCAGILLLQWQGENVAHRQHLKFATLNLYTVPAKILYLQRYSTDFRNLCLSSKILSVGIWVERFRCSDILFLQFHGENFAHRQLLKFLPLSTCTLCQQKYSISKGIQPIFEIFASSSKTLRVGIWVESFRGAGILLLQWRGENRAHRQHLKFFHFQTCTLCQEKSYFAKGFQPIFEILASARRCWGRAFGWKLQVRWYFILHWQGEYFAHRQHLKFCHFQPVHCASKNPISP